MYVIKRGDEVFIFETIRGVADFICNNMDVPKKDCDRIWQYVDNYFYAANYQKACIILEEDFIPLAAKYGLTIEEIKE